MARPKTKEMTLAQRVAYHIRRLRKKNNLLVVEAAMGAGISISHWYKLENPDYSFGTFKTLEKVADFFEVDPGELFR